MQCQSQLDSPGLQESLAIKSSIRARNVVWFKNRNTIECEEESMIAFEDIECMTIERFYNNYMNSKGHPDYRIVNLGHWSVNLKKRIEFLTDNPDNIEMQRIVMRGETHHRIRPDRPENSRFAIGSEFDSLSKRSINDVDFLENWLGETWRRDRNNYSYPSLSQIKNGLVAEALV